MQYIDLTRALISSSPERTLLIVTPRYLILFTNQARRQRGGIGGIAPLIRFLFLPPRFFFFALPLYFFLKVSIAYTVKIVVILTVPSPILTSILFD